MSKEKDIRWQQRFMNYEKALNQLAEGLDVANPTELEQEGIIQRFEYTFDLSWKTLKDYLQYQGYQDITGSRDTFREAFKSELIESGEVWMRMIESRNLTSHTYDEETAANILESITEEYFPLFLQLKKRLEIESESG
ncbi:MAG TPA: nucleotidyltransferase substrate binding protein [Balneolaceae bacterium]